MTVLDIAVTMIRRVLMVSTTTAACALLGEQVHMLNRSITIFKSILYRTITGNTWYNILFNIGLNERGLHSGTHPMFSVQTDRISVSPSFLFRTIFYKVYNTPIIRMA